MHIGWHYLDKKGAAAKALKDFERMQFILAHTEGAIRQEYARIGDAGICRADGLPRARDPGIREKRVAGGIETIDGLRERLRTAEEYMAWFRPAWEALSEEERFVLAAFYGEGNGYGAGAAEAVGERFFIERASAYRRKERALGHLATLLYGG